MKILVDTRTNPLELPENGAGRAGGTNDRGL